MYSGKKVGDPVLCDSLQLLYQPNGAIEYVLDYADEFELIPIRYSGAANITDMPLLRKSAIVIRPKKYSHF